MKKLLLLLLLPLFALACTHKDLHDEDVCGTGDTPVKVVVNWDDPATQARAMRINIFSRSAGVEDYGRDQVPASGQKTIYLYQGASYRPLCYDYGVENIYFRGETSLDGFEATLAGASRATYTTYASPVAGEATRAAPAGSEFYVHSWLSDFHVNPVPGTELVLNFYPKNILREFTYRIDNILGVKNIQEARGAISGMPATYFFATDRATDVRSTVLFTGSRTGTDPDTGQGYIEGAFYVFYPAPPYQNRFTIEVFSKSDIYYTAYWDVSGQVAASMADRDAKLALDGYDIRITNNPDTGIPDIPDGGGSGSGSGFEIGVGGWNDTEIIELK